MAGGGKLKPTFHFTEVDMKKITAFISSIFLILGIMSCSSGSSSHSDDSSPSGASSSRLLSFDLSNAAAIASVESAGNSARFARAAEADDSPLVKVLDDSTIASVLSLPSDVNVYNFPKIKAVKTVEDTFGHKYLYIRFEHSFSWGCHDETTDEWKDENMSQLLCVYEDGSYVDILGGLKSSSDTYIDIGYYNDTGFGSNIDFDAAGNMYLCTSEYDGSSSSSVFYKYDVSAKEASRLTARNSNANYSKFQISADGKILIVSGSNTNGNFIRCIPTDSPNDMKFIVVPGDNYGYSSWVYQNSTDYFYMPRSYEVTINNDSYMEPYTQTKNGLFRIRISDFMKNNRTPEWERISPETDNYYIGNLCLTSTGIWDLMSHYYDNSNNFVYLVDNEGNYKGETISAQSYKFNNTVISDDALYFADNSAGTGYQTIIRFDLSEKTFSNLFDNVPNRNLLEVVSFSEGNGMLYFSATKGIDNVNGSINLRTKEFTPMDSSKKITSITSY